MSTSNKLFGDSDEEDEGELHINKAYAEKYESWRRGEEIQKLKDRLGDDVSLDSDSESSSDSDFVEPDNPEFDHDFFVTLGALHKTDVNLEEKKFFTRDYRKRDKKDKKDNDEDKAMTIKEYQRHIIVDREGKLDDDEEQGVVNSRKVMEEEFPKGKVNLDDNLSSDEDSGDDLLTSGLFKVKDKPTEDKQKPSKRADDAIAFVKGESSSFGNSSDKDLLEGLKEAWNDPNLSKEDKWLADFFLNKRYLEDEDESIEREYNEAIIDEETLSEDEKTLQAMDTFETKYRFRYEEPDEEFIKRYPRVIEDSVRTKDERRKQHREALKKRKAEEKEQKRQEIQKLKALKYKEIQDKIEKIKEASGNTDIDLGDKDLEDEFDPEAHDSAMTRMFGDDYYAVDGDMEKPVFSDDEDIIQDYDDWLEKEGGVVGSGGDANTSWEGAGDNYGDWEEGGEFNMDADYDPSSQARKELEKMMVESSRKKKCRRKSKFAKALSKKKPVFNPNEKDFDSYFEEYYQLNFEDIVGGMPCRFQYQKVESNSFGLTTEEILSAQDKELNKWYSLKKMMRYDRTQEDEQRDERKYSQRASLLRVKQKILPSLFTEDPEELQVAEQEKKRIKNLKKKLRRMQREHPGEEVDIENNPYLQARKVEDLLPGWKTGEGKKQLNESSGEKSPKKKNVPPVASENPEGECAFASQTEDTPITSKKRKMETEETEDTPDNLENGKLKTKKRKVTESECDKASHDTAQVENENTAAVSDAAKEVGDQNQQKKRRKKKKKKKQPGNNTVNNANNARMKHKKATSQKESSLLHGISDSRLAAYGENPKKFKNKVKYGKKSFE